MAAIHDPELLAKAKRARWKSMPHQAKIWRET